MKHLLLTTIAAVLLVGCATTQQPEPSTVEAPDYDIWLSARLGNIEAVKQHLAAGTDVNAKGVAGWTALHHAAYDGHKEVVELLIANGADVNVRSRERGSTPLHHAALLGHNQVIELLIAKGADVNAKDDNGDTPLDTALTYVQAETADLLRKHGGKTGEELKAEGK
jgi:ankyrin repeat protein